MARWKDSSFGFAIWGPMLRARLYAVQTAPTVGMYYGDVVAHGGTGLSTKFGYRVIVEDSAHPDGNDHLLGAIVGIYDEDMDPAMYIAAAETGDSTVAGYIMVADHPMQEFLVQEDADTTPIPLASIGQNVDLITTDSGTTGTGLSGFELDSNTAATTQALQCKLHYPHPEDTVPATATYHTRWIVTINEHFFGRQTDGI